MSIDMKMEKAKKDLEKKIDDIKIELANLYEPYKKQILENDPSIDKNQILTIFDLNLEISMNINEKLK